MERVGIKEFKNRATQIVRDVRERSARYVVTVDGEPAAILKPYEAAEEATVTDDDLEEWLREWDELAEEIGKAWPKGLTGPDAVPSRGASCVSPSSMIVDASVCRLAPSPETHFERSREAGGRTRCVGARNSMLPPFCCRHSHRRSVARTGNTRLANEAVSRLLRNPRLMLTTPSRGALRSR